MRGVLLIVAAGLLAGAGTQAAGQAAYLKPGQVPDGVAILPPPPVPGGAADRADRRIFVATRGLRGSARWRIATDDVSNDPLDRYACALGLQLTPQRVPALARLLGRAGTGDLVDPVKTRYHKRRPYLASNAPICEAKTAHLAGNGDYPSGHAANGWLEALILAALVPDRAGPLLARGRAYGESRVVCGSHTASAVAAGWMAGAAAFAVISGTPGFRGDFDAAAGELAGIDPRQARPDPARCAAEQAALAVRPW